MKVQMKYKAIACELHMKTNHIVQCEMQVI